MKRLILVSCLIAAAAAVPAGASASTSVIASGPDSYGPPALSGDRVVASVLRDQHTSYLYSLGAGAPAKRLLTNRSNGAEFAFIAYGASAQRVAAVRVGEASPGNAQFFSGPPLGPLSQVAICAPAPENQVLVPDVDGQLAAW